MWLSNGRLYHMCVRERERGSYTYEQQDKWGIINIKGI